MDTISLNPLDKKDLLELLEFARQQKIAKRGYNIKGKFDYTNWWLIRIEQLKKIINGYVPSGSYIQSNFETIEYEMNKKEKNQYKYRKSLESEIENVFDSKD